MLARDRSATTCRGGATKTSATSTSPGCSRGGSRRCSAASSGRRPCARRSIRPTRASAPAIACYPTQLLALEEDWQIAAKLAAPAPEQFWRLAPPPEAGKRRSPESLSSAAADQRPRQACPDDDGRLDAARLIARRARGASGSWASAVQMNNVRPSGPPSAHANVPRPVATSSRSVAAFGDADAPVGCRARDPDRAFGVEADAVGRRADRRAATPTRGGSTACRRRAMSNAVRRAAVLSPTISVRVVGRDDRAVREAELVGRDPRPTVGFDREEVRLAPRLAAVHVEAEVADVGATAARRRPCRCSSRARASRDPRARSSAPSWSRSTFRSTIDTTSIDRRAASRARWAGSAPRRSSRTFPSCRPRRRAGRACRRRTAGRRASAALRGTRVRRAGRQVSARSGPYSSGRSVGLTSSSVCSCVSGRRGTKKIAATSPRCRTARSNARSRRADPTSVPAITRPGDGAEDADDQQQRVRRAAQLGGEQLGVEGAERDPGRGGGQHRDRGRDPEQAAAVEEEDHLRRRRDQQRDDRDRLAAALLGEPAADHEADEAGERGGDRPEQRDAGVREVADVRRGTCSSAATTAR